MSISKGLSAPYCKVSVRRKANSYEDFNGTNTIQSPSPTPNGSIRRTASLFSCASSQCILFIECIDRLIYFLISAGKSKSKSSVLRRSSGQTRSTDRFQASITGANKPLNSLIRRTQVQRKTINPEWNEHFELYVNDYSLEYLCNIILSI